MGDGGPAKVFMLRRNVIGRRFVPGKPQLRTKRGAKRNEAAPGGAASQEALGPES